MNEGPRSAGGERRVDGLMMILSGIRGRKRMITVDELRKNIEALPPEAYERMNYYDRWVGTELRHFSEYGIGWPSLTRTVTGVVGGLLGLF